MSLPLLISIGLFVLLMAGITAFGHRRYAKPGRFFAQLGVPVVTGGPRVLADPETPAQGPLTKLLSRIGERVPQSPLDASALRRSLMMAGYRSDQAITKFYGIKVMAAAAMLLAAITLRPFAGNPAMRLMMIGVATAFGYMAPSMVLERLIKARQERLRLSLPDALDLMVVSVEAGLGLDQAIQHVSRELQMSHREVAEEWGLVNLEMRAGKRRAEALRNLAERTGEEELRKLVAILVQNDRFGTSMAESLRTHSDFMRTRRRQDAEERAGKVGVKLVFPIFLFILPSMMIVTAGPAMLAVFKHLFPMMRDFK